MALKCKQTSLGLVEIRESNTPGWYELYVNNSLKERSRDLSFIMSQYDKY